MRTFKEFCALKEADEKISPDVVQAVSQTATKGVKIGAVPQHQVGAAVKKLPQLDPKKTSQAVQIMTGDTPEK